MTEISWICSLGSVYIGMDEVLHRSVHLVSEFDMDHLNNIIITMDGVIVVLCCVYLSLRRCAHDFMLNAVLRIGMALVHVGALLYYLVRYVT